MNDKKTYILFVFAIHDDPDTFVEALGSEISLVTMSPDVRYYYGPQASVYTFSSFSSFNDLNSILKVLLNDLGITYMFLPLDKSKFGSGFDEDVNTHLFGIKPLSLKPINVSKLDEIRKELEDMLTDDDDFEENEIEKLKSKPYTPSVNEILDKIGQYGVKSLSKEEKTILDNYSKQL